MDLFGYTVSRRKAAQTTSFVPPTEDGAIDTVQTGTGAGYYGTYLDLEGAAKNEADLIKKYREISQTAQVDLAIEDIVNEAIANLDDEDPIKISFDKLPDGTLSGGIKNRIEREFRRLLTMLDYKRRAQDYFRRWYVDGRLYFHKVVDTDALAKGIVDIRYIDPRTIKKVREIIKEKNAATGVDIIKGHVEYFVYAPSLLGQIPAGQQNSFKQSQAGQQPIRVNKDAITYVSSGLVDLNTNMVLGYLHKAIKPTNQLRMLENAHVINALARAPERRIFYIDVGNLPKAKAEQYVKDIMNKYRNQLVYDAQTGEIRDDKKHMSMLEDFWLPRKEGGKGTQIETLPGMQNTGDTGLLEYFKHALYESLNVPMSRLQNEGGGFNFGKAAEITRDELKFSKFVGKLRRKFAEVFIDLLKTQVLLKNIMTENEWNEIEDLLEFVFAQDAFYAEQKEQEIFRARLELLALASGFDGRYLGKTYIQKNILKLSEEERAEMEVEMKKDPNPLVLGAAVDAVAEDPEPAPAAKPAAKKKD